MLIIGILMLILVVLTPTALMVLLFYAGEKSRREEQVHNRFYRRGFEVKPITGGRPVLKEDDHG